LQYHSLSDPLTTPTPASLRTRISTLSTLSRILRDEGLTALWKGNVPAELLYLTYGAVQFLAYRSTTQLLSSLASRSAPRDNGTHHTQPLPGSVVSFVSGAAAGTAATTATYPLDLLRTRFAAQGKDRVYNGFLAGVREISRVEGPSGFFRGLSAGVAQIVPYMGLFFSLYEGFKPVCVGMPMTGLGSGEAVAGVMASVCAKTVVFPLDTVRKRLQVQGPMLKRYGSGMRVPEYGRGVLGTIRMIAVREGWKGLYRGLPVSLIKAAPASAITVWTYERTMGLLRSIEGEN